MALVFSVTSATADTGKTTVAEQLIACFARRGLAVAALKHTRGPVELDRPGSDTHRFSQAGAKTVVLSGPNALLRFESRFTERELDALLESVRDHDVVVVEGYKESLLPKVVVYRAVKGVAFPAGLPRILAAVSDDPLPAGVVSFGFSEIDHLAGWLLESLPKSVHS